MCSVAILEFISGLTIFLFYLHFLKFVKCRQGLMYYRAAFVKSRGLHFIIPFMYVKNVSTELCIVLCVL